MTYAITSHTKNKIAVKVTHNSIETTEYLSRIYQVIFSDTVTKSMDDLSRLGIISYGPCKDHPKISKMTSPIMTSHAVINTPAPRRGRRSKSSDITN